MSQTVIPIFYEVEPPDVKTQIGSLGSIFEEDRVWRPVGDVEKWKQALYEVVSISGYYSRDWLVIFICSNHFGTSLYMCSDLFINILGKMKRK